MTVDFRELYGSAEGLRVWKAPGAINLIGDHTEYNLGFVLPIALQLAAYIGAAPASDGKLRIFSEDREELREWQVGQIGGIERSGHWTDYLIGVAQQLLAAGFEIVPANLLIRSTIPDGAGFRSSAALEVCAGLALSNGRAATAPLELARLCQRAEREFVGNPCGLADPYTSIFASEGAAIEIDCRDVEHRFVPLPAGVTFLAVHAIVKHPLTTSAYRERLRDCEQAVAGIRRKLPWIESLRDVTSTKFEAAAADLEDTVKRRAEHVITENDRVGRFVQASAQGDLQLMGTLLLESHRSLQYDYDVSRPELDFLVDTALEMDGVFGARMTAGGCTLNMLRADAAAQFTSDIVQAYESEFRVSPEVYECKAAAGAGEVRDLVTIPPAGYAEQA